MKSVAKALAKDMDMSVNIQHASDIWRTLWAINMGAVEYKFEQVGGPISPLLKAHLTDGRDVSLDVGDLIDEGYVCVRNDTLELTDAGRRNL